MTLWDFCYVSDAGSIANWQRCTELQGHHVQIKLAEWAIKPSKVCTYEIKSDRNRLEKISDDLYMHHSYIFIEDYVYLRLQKCGWNWTALKTITWNWDFQPLECYVLQDMLSTVYVSAGEVVSVQYQREQRLVNPKVMVWTSLNLLATCSLLQKYV